MTPTSRNPLAAAGALLTVLCLSIASAAGGLEPAADIQQTIALLEYGFGWSPDGRATAPNRAGGLRVFVGPDAFEVVPRTDEVEEFRLELRLTEWGRGNSFSAARPGVVAAEGRDVEMRRPGLTEWLENEPDGLKHGFTLPAPPPGDEDATSVALRLAVGGTLRPYPAGSDSIDFRNAEGRDVVRYGGLVVFDAAERVLPSAIAIDEKGILLTFDDTGAIYPVTVDPVLSGASWTRNGGQAAASLGLSVATAGDIDGDGYSDVIVGAPGFDNGEDGEGRAFLFRGGPSGLSSTPAWTAESNVAGAQFGDAVSTAGDVNGDGYHDVLVGAPGFSNPQASEGRAYLFLGSATGLATTPAWTAESNVANARFGDALSTAGDVNGDGYSDIIVGAFSFSGGQTDEGKAFVYHGSASGLSATPNWTFEANQSGAFVGISVSTAGDVNGDGFADVIVGGHAFDAAFNNEGRAWVFAGSPSGLSATPLWIADGGQDSALFGAAVSTAGDVNGDGYADIIVGANGHDTTQNDAGRAYIFLGSAGGPATAPSFTLSGSQAGARFGVSVATAGDVDGDGRADVIIGAHRYTNGESQEGRAYVYRGSASGAMSLIWTGESNQAGANFGRSVATAGDVDGDGYSDILVGAPGFDGAFSNEGRVYLYRGTGDGLTANSVASRRSNQAGAELGYSVASAGDVNGDGFSDVIVGAPFFDNGSSDEGRAFVFHGSASGLSTVANWTAESNQTSAWFGWSVASAGDVNGDGYADVIVGAPLYDNGQSNEGRAYVYHGSASGLSATAAWIAESNHSNAWFGDHVASAGDVNGDGYSDVLVGAPVLSNGQLNEGRAYLYLGSATGLSTSAAWTAESNNVEAYFGNSLASAGDVNGDGYSDVIVGAPYFSGGQTYEGKVYLYRGGPDGLEASPWWTWESNQANANAGFAVASAGDFNGDGLGDFVFSAPGYDGDLVDEGYVYVFRGNAASTPSLIGWVEGNVAGTLLGASVGTAGDVNGDGYSDLVIGDPERGGGYVTVWHGGPGGIPASPSWSKSGTMGGITTQFHFGLSVATAGDVNGDGFDDLLVGAPGNGFLDLDLLEREGLVYLYYGGGGGGLDRRPNQQQPSSSSAPLIGPLGRSTGEASTRLRVRARTPAGRGLVRVEYEIKPIDEPLDGSDTRFSNQTLLTSSPSGDGSRINYSTNLSSLPGGPEYRWRLRVRSPDPLFPGSRWLSLAGRAPTEMALRTSCTKSTWYLDADGDNYGVPTDTVFACTPPVGYVDNDDDCDDNDSSVNPGAIEIGCDGIDNDCNPATPDVFDADGDGFHCNLDCDDGDSNVWSVPSVVTGLELSRTTPGSWSATLAWNAPVDPGGRSSLVRYDTVRSLTPDDFVSGAGCIDSAGSDLVTIDNQSPHPGVVFHYLVVARTTCGRGPTGTNSDGMKRPLRICP